MASWSNFWKKYKFYAVKSTFTIFTPLVPWHISAIYLSDTKLNSQDVYFILLNIFIWQVSLNILQVNLVIWQVDLIILQFDLVIWLT